MVFINWEPPPQTFLEINFDGSLVGNGGGTSLPLTFLKINFDGSLVGNGGGTSFAIHAPNVKLVAAGWIHVFNTSVPDTKLRATWAGIVYVRRVLQADQLIVEGDLATIIGWIQGWEIGTHGHPLPRDI